MGVLRRFFGVPLFGCLLLLVGTCVGGVSQYAQPMQRTGAARIEVPRDASPFVVLAGAMARAESFQRLEFVQVTLDALIDAYENELRSAMAERPREQERRRKLARWKNATRTLLDELQGIRWRLGEVADIDIHVDGVGSVILFVGDMPVIVSAPRPALEKQIAQSVVEQYCAFNDCSFLQTPAAGLSRARSAARGSWSFGTLDHPVYETAQGLRCVYADLAARGRKAQLCIQLSEQLIELRDALADAQRRGFWVDWRFIADTPPRHTAATLVTINGDGIYVRRSLPLVARLDARDWRDVVAWLGAQAVGRSAPLIVSHADRLVAE